MYLSNTSNDEIEWFKDSDLYYERVYRCTCDVACEEGTFAEGSYVLLAPAEKHVMSAKYDPGFVAYDFEKECEMPPRILMSQEHTGFFDYPCGINHKNMGVFFEENENISEQWNKAKSDFSRSQHLTRRLITIGSTIVGIGLFCLLTTLTFAMISTERERIFLTIGAITSPLGVIILTGGVVAHTLSLKRYFNTRRSIRDLCSTE